MSWALLGSSALIAGCALFFGMRYVPRRASVVDWRELCSDGVLSCDGDWSSLERTRSRRYSKPQAKAHIAPAADAQSTFELKAGEIVTAQREYGDFVLSAHARSTFRLGEQERCRSRHSQTFHRSNAGERLMKTSKPSVLII